MTRKEITNSRDLTFSRWIRINLPDSYSGFRVSDLDFVLCNVDTKKIMLLEIKTRNSKPRNWQRELWTLMNKWVKKGIDDDWQYLGFNLIQFENTCFTDGNVYLNYEKITEADLIEYLSLK